MRSLTTLAGAFAAVTLSALVVAASRRAPIETPPPLPADPPHAQVDLPPRVAERPPLPPAPKSWVTERGIDGPPVGLTASDGSGLRLASLRADAVVEGPLAFTELHLAFDNPEDRVREGTFKIVLPQGASIGRLAMKIGDVWQEGEVVKKQQAREAYEDALHHKQDPALMEKGAGNELTARVFPIPARGRKEIIVSYAQELADGAPYALPLRGLPELGTLDLSVAGIDGAPQTQHREHYTPLEDFVSDGSGAPVEALRSGHLVVARVRPAPEAMPDPVTNAVVLIDTSASRALGLPSELRAVKEMLRGLSERGDVTVSVAAFDQEIARVYQGDARGFGDAEIAKLLERRALGASNVERALGWARDEARATNATRVILVTDGVATAGEQDASRLAAVASALKLGGAARLDVVAVGGIRDDAVAHKLVTAGLPHDGVVADAGDGASAVVRRLESGTKSDIAVAVEGATWSYPTRLDGVQPGDESLVYAEIPDGAKLRVRVGDGAPVDLDTKAGDAPLLQRAWAQAKVASLESEERDHGRSADLERRIVDLSLKHRVLSRYTSLLVLESDADYARFDLDRRALADVLTVEGGRLAWLKRSEAPWGEAVATRVPPTHGFGGKPLSGIAPPPRPRARDLDEESADKPAAVDEGVGLGSIGASGGGVARAKVDERAMGNPSRGLASPPAPASMAAATPAAAPMAMAMAAATPAAAPMAMATAAPTPGPLVASAPDPSQPKPPSDALQAAMADSSNGGYGVGSGAQTRAAAMAPRRMTAAGSMGGGGESGVDPYTGKMKQVKGRLAAHDPHGAFDLASTWQAGSPGDVMALVALGEAAEATRDLSTASRAYGSLIDLFPSRADIRRFAGERLEHIQGGAALELAIDTFDKARRDRPDQPESHRLAAYARVRRGEYAAAFDILEAGAARSYPQDRFLGVDRILHEDLGLVAAAWMKANPSHKGAILRRLAADGGTIEDAPSIRFVLNWETDANDVDFHIEDAEGGHAYFGAPHLPSGGDLYADVTTGYGPECFTLRQPRGKRAAPYTVKAHYYARGPMGYGMGKLEIVEHDGRGGLTFEERPFVVMADHAFVDLGVVPR